VPELHSIIELLIRNCIQHALQIVEGRAFVLEVGGELKQNAAQETRLCQGLDADLFKRGGPEDRLGFFSLDQCLVGDKLGNLQRVLEALFVFALLYPGVDLELSRWPIKSAVDLDCAEVLGIIIKPGSFLFVSSIG